MKKEGREVELKYRLPGRAAWERLCRALGRPVSDRVQVNHYFRSADGRIPGESGVIRVRVEQGRAVFTVKLGGSLVRGLSSAREYEEPWETAIDSIPSQAEVLWDAGFEGMRAVERAFGERPPLVWAGCMENRRRKYPFGEDLLLEVDASCYPGGAEDFEVELETGDPESDRIRLVRLLDDLGIPHEPQEETKYQRFLRHASACPAKPRAASGPLGTP